MFTKKTDLKISIYQNIYIIALIALTITGVIVHSIFGLSGPGFSGHAIGSDDAYISFRYAENLFNGNGLVFNPGERVEGYSNFLFTLLMVPAFLISDKATYIYSIVINCILLSATIYIFFKFSEENFQSKHQAFCGAFLLGINPWIWINAATGLETTLILAISTYYWIYTERYISSGSKRNLTALTLLTILSILSRVDGFILPLVVYFYALLKKENDLAKNIIKTIIFTLAIYTLFRIIYYNDYIANTYYNKVSGNLIPRIKAGIFFVVEHTKNTGLWIPVLITLITLALNPFNKKHKTSLSLPHILIPIWIGYLIWIGGDIYFERFLVALIPMGIYVTVKNIFQYTKGIPQWIALSLIFLSQSIFAISDGRFAYEDSLTKYDGWVLFGNFLKENYPRKTIAVDAAGKIPYFSKLRTIDMLGLNDKHIGKIKLENSEFFPGHQKFDPAYVLSLKPDLIMAWTDKKENLSYGLDAKTYQSEYKLKYLVNLRRDSKSPYNIIDVSNQTKANIESLISDKEYNYAVLIRKSI